jgi:hypothetical protein
MTKATIRARPIRGDRPYADIYLPHSSWSRADQKPAPAPPIAAEDFWARLGL